MWLFSTYKKLKEKGVLGINSRNADHILKLNKRKFYPLADSKLSSKLLAQEADLPVPELYEVFSYVYELKTITERLKAYDSFVIKPEHGSGGDGVLVLKREEDGNLYDTDGVLADEDYLQFHVSNILFGLYSLGGQPDRALAEYRVNFSKVFEEISYKGVPDIRVIVMYGIPVMAMLRLPTKKSHGKANLHQGAIGVGIDLATGITRGGVSASRPIDVHPDTNNKISGIQIPFWRDILEIASKSNELFKLNYIGIDIVLDKDRGPMILEVNVRPGLAIQMANRIGLKHRLVKIKQEHKNYSTMAERVDFSQNVVAKIF